MKSVKLPLESKPEVCYNRDANTNEGNGPFLLSNFLTPDIIGNRVTVLNGPSSFVLAAAYEGLTDCGFSFSRQKNRTDVCTIGSKRPYGEGFRAPFHGSRREYQRRNDFIIFPKVLQLNRGRL